ncbi:hypothetical protein TSUD_130650 [Trifolium subterraneum]|nr:hypothetical protein TSUD_130650 [Trifolium subterraneum]
MTLSQAKRDKRYPDWWLEEWRVSSHAAKLKPVKGFASWCIGSILNSSAVESRTISKASR